MLCRGIDSLINNTHDLSNLEDEGRRAAPRALRAALARPAGRPHTIEITVEAQPTYAIAVPETLVVTLPAAVLMTGSEVVAAPSALDEQRADLEHARRGVAALRDAHGVDAKLEAYEACDKAGLAAELLDRVAAPADVAAHGDGSLCGCPGAVWVAT